MNKTPVSILQEMMVKKQMVPNYELIHDGGGTHINTFIYRVSCDGIVAMGAGRSKKDAKHEAAKAMLKAIASSRNYPQLPASSEDTPMKTPSPTVKIPMPNSNLNLPFINAVGALQELCSENTLDEPEYNLISDVGPPHARIFTYQCVVATFKEEGVGTTKKQAKQEASKRMLDKIQYLIKDLKQTNIDVRPQELIANEIAKAKYSEFHKLQPTIKNNLGLKLSQYHVALRNHFDEEIRTDLRNKLSAIVPENNKYNFAEEADKLLSSLRDCLVSFNLEVSVINLPSTVENCIVAAKVNTCPDLVEVMTGDIKEQVEFNTLLKLIDTMIFFLKQ